jgi:DNA polymerase V
LIKKPVAVLSSNDGCIVARSQEIKDLGIPMGVPYFQVKEICEKAGATLFSSNFTLYRDISTRVMQVLASEVGPCEIYSIDEAFFETTDTVTPEEIKRIREKITKDVGVPVSIGVSTTKTLAKQASSIAKKGNGVCILNGNTIQNIYNLPCSSVWGLGRQTSIKLRERGVTTIGEFLALDRSIIRRDFGVGGERIYSELQGIVVHSFGQNSEDIRQSITSSRSFEKTTKVQHEVESAVAYHVSAAAEKLRLLNLVASRMYVTIQASRHGDFLLRKGTSEIILTEPTSSTHDLIKEALAHVGRMYDREVPYKKVGVVLSGLMPKTYVTGTLFEKTTKETASVDTITDSINEKFGHGSLRFGVILTNASRASAKLRSKEYTTSWKDIPLVCVQ